MENSLIAEITHLQPQFIIMTVSVNCIKFLAQYDT